MPPTSALIIVTVGFLASCSLSASREPDLERWAHERIKISPYELTFRVPGGHSSAVPSPATGREIDLKRDFSSDTSTVVLFMHAWDYHEFLLPGVAGIFDMTVAVKRKPHDYTPDLTSLDTLQRLVEQNLERVYAPRNQEARALGNTRFVVSLPTEYRRTTIRSRDWLVYALGGWKDSMDYATPITSAHYLLIGFDFVDNSRGRTTSWRRNAQKVADQIIASLELRKLE